MLSYVQSGFLIGVALMISMVTVMVLNRIWPIPKRKLINDVTGWQLGILGDDVWSDSRIHALHGVE